MGDVNAVLEGGEVTEEAVVAKTRRLVHVDACLFIPFSTDLVASESVTLDVVDKKGQMLVSVEIPLADLADAENLTMADLHTMSDDDGKEVDAHISLILMGTCEADGAE